MDKERNLTLKDVLADADSTARIKELTYENGVKILEELVEKVESGSLPLEKAILAYEKGVELVRHLRSLLSGAEEKLRILQKSAKDGKLSEQTVEVPGK